MAPNTHHNLFSICHFVRISSITGMRTTDTFVSNTTGERFTIKTHASCKTLNVIYLIECRRCGLQYVGETGQPLHCRMNGYRFDIVHGRVEESPVAAHFYSSGHTEADVTIMAIDKLCRNDVILRKIRESRWIRTLGSSWPKGMNLRTDGL